MNVRRVWEFLFLKEEVICGWSAGCDEGTEVMIIRSGPETSESTVT